MNRLHYVPAKQQQAADAEYIRAICATPTKREDRLLRRAVMDLRTAVWEQGR